MNYVKALVRLVIIVIGVIFVAPFIIGFVMSIVSGIL